MGKSPRSLKEAIYVTVHRSKKNINEIAEDLSLSDNQLYRYCYNEEDSSHADLPLRRLLPLIKTTGNFAILDYLENRLGRVAIKIPSLSASRFDEDEMMEKYHGQTIEAVQALRAFFKNPTGKTYRIVDEHLRAVIKETVKVNKYANKKMKGQFELWDE